MKNFYKLLALGGLGLAGGSGGGLDALIDRSITEIKSSVNAEFPEKLCYRCQQLITVDIPNVTKLNNQAFSTCTKLTSANCRNATAVGSETFSGCISLRSVDFSCLHNIYSQAFINCYILSALILRSETMCNLNSSNAFNYCWALEGEQHSIYNPDGIMGYIYVPSALIETYKVATNWVKYAERFRALEDYTVDGTTTGELDESKI